MIISTQKFSEVFGGEKLLDIGNRVQLVGCVLAGKSDGYLLIFPDEVAAADGMAFKPLEMTLADWEAMINQSDLLNVAITNGPNKAIVRKSARQIDQNVAWTVYERDGYVCRYCARRVPLTVDHIVCWEHGGPSIVANLLSSCRRCNRDRGNMLYHHWIESPTYAIVSENLTAAQREANIAVIETLPRLEAMRATVKRSR